MLCVSQLSKRFGKNEIFSDFNLIIPENKFIVLIGPSGCGKTTLFDVLTGVTPMEKGNILWKGLQVKNLEKRCAYMQQKDLLLPWLTLLKNAVLPAEISGADPEKSKIKAKLLFKRMGLAGYENFRPHEISGGMRQRCALIRTLMFPHDFILLDEPLSSLDAITRRSLQSLLLLLQTEFSKTLLMITHDIEEALLLADEIYLLSVQPMGIREKFILDSPKPRKFNDPLLLEIEEHVMDVLQGDISGDIDWKIGRDIGGDKSSDAC